MNQYLERLNWRYATKKFNPEKKLSEAQITFLTHALQLSPSSYGLQPWHFLVVTNPELRQELSAAAYGQPQITEASHLIVLCARKTMDSAAIHHFMEQLSETREVPLDSLEQMKSAYQASADRLTPQQQFDWNKHQTYIALGFLISAAMSQKIDSCPMEGFNASEFNRILGLEETDYSAAVLCAVGFRDESDPAIQLKKVRFPLEEVVEWRK